MPAADIEKPSCRHLGANDVEHAGRRAPAPGLLLQIGVVTHLAIEVGEVRLLSKHGLLQGPALSAGKDV
jgi:hypothetical protein